MNADKPTRRQIVATGAAALAGSALLPAAAAQQPSPATRPANDHREHGAQPPGEAERDYTPVVVPNGWTLPWKLVDGAKVFHLVAEEVDHEFAPGLRARCWGYNGSVHGPLIEAVEGDRVRIFVTNRLPAATSVHWHGFLLPSGMDGVAGLSQKAIRSGETFVYEFTLRQHGTLMYHSHHDEMTQMALGMTGMFVIHPRNVPREQRPDRDFALLLHEWALPVGAARPDPNEMTDFNLLTINARAFPGTAPLIAKLGDRVHIRFGNLSAMDHHPMHLHGYHFRVTGTDAGPIPPSAQHRDGTILVPVGSTRDIEFTADNPGDWALHCHMTHHVMNQMGHEFPNMIGVNPAGLDARIKPLLPDYMTMGHTGMSDMAEHIEGGHMKVPPNSIPMIGAAGPHDYITMGGMFIILKVREELPGGYGEDPGWYVNPPGTLAAPADAGLLRRNGVAADGSSAPRSRTSVRPATAPATRPAHEHHH